MRRCSRAVVAPPPVRTDPSSAAARAAYDQATVRCITPQTKCLGLPPHSCTAFGEKYILSISDPAACDRCPDSLLLPALTFAGLALVVMMITGGTRRTY
jgi:hypothetical protein